MKHKQFFVLFILSFFVCNVSCAAKWRAEHVILIGLDGWGAYSVPKADMPNVKKLMDAGSYTLENRSVLPSSSAVNWASMFMGAGPELHGFTEWGSQKPDLPSRELSHYGMFPSIFGLLRDAYPSAEIGYVYEWDGIGYLVENDAVNYRKHTPVNAQNPKGCTDAAVKYIIEKRPNFFAVIYDQPDGVGHKDGHDTDAYYKKLAELDSYVGELIEAVKQAGMLDKTIFIVTADHGGIGKGHGGKTMQEMQTPFIISGKGIKKGVKITQSTMVFDTASTIAYIFKLNQPQVWIGRPIKQAFK